MGRKVGREGCMKLLYQMEMNNMFEEAEIINFLDRVDSIELKNLDRSNLENIDEDLIYGTDERNFITEIIADYLNNRDMIDKIIADNAEGWNLNRLAKVDLAILRISIVEMILREDIPTKVSINEAIELSKKYSNEDSYKFINGILGSVAKEFNKNG